MKKKNKPFQKISEVWLPKELFDINDSDFISIASGNGMINAGISSGDTLIFKEVTELDNGKIGAFIIKGKDAAVKRYHKQGKIITLSYDDDGTQAPFVLKEKDVEILGELKYIIKKI